MLSKCCTPFTLYLVTILQIKYTVLSAIMFFTQYWTLHSTHQIDSNSSSYQVSNIDVNWVTAMLRYLCQPSEACCHAEGEHQQGFQEFGRGADASVKVHLRRQDIFKINEKNKANRG